MSLEMINCTVRHFTSFVCQYWYVEHALPTFVRFCKIVRKVQPRKDPQSSEYISISEIIKKGGNNAKRFNPIVFERSNHGSRRCIRDWPRRAVDDTGRSRDLGSVISTAMRRTVNSCLSHPYISNQLCIKFHTLFRFLVLVIRNQLPIIRTNCE